MSPVRRCKKSRFLTPHWLLFIPPLKLPDSKEGSVREEATRRGHSGNCQPTRTQCVAPRRRNAMHDPSKPIHAERTSFPSILIHHTFHCQYTFALSRSLVDARTRCVRRLINYVNRLLCPDWVLAFGCSHSQECREKFWSLPRRAPRSRIPSRSACRNLTVPIIWRLDDPNLLAAEELLWPYNVAASAYP
jgi:hypothetical protein